MLDACVLQRVPIPSVGDPWSEMSCGGKERQTCRPTLSFANLWVEVYMISVKGMRSNSRRLYTTLTELMSVAIH